MPTYFTQHISLLLCSSAEHAVYALGGLDYQKLLAGHAPLKNTFSIAMEMEEVNKTQTILSTDEQKLSPIPQLPHVPQKLYLAISLLTSDGNSFKLLHLVTNPPIRAQYFCLID